MLKIAQHLQNHKAFNAVFNQDKLSFGLIAPFKGYGGHSPDMSDWLDTLHVLDQSAISALWIRDVPFYDPSFGDTGQIYDPFVFASFLAANTSKIAIGTAGIIAPFREPINATKSATSLDILSNERFIFGLSTGDRMSEYEAFGEDYLKRSDRFKEWWQISRALQKEDFLNLQTKEYGNFNARLDFLPKKSLAMVAVGRCQQELSWLANIPDAWITHGINPYNIQSITQSLRELNKDNIYRPFAYANFVELTPDPNYEVKLWNNIFVRGGVKKVVQYYMNQYKNGLSHILLNLRPSELEPISMLNDLSEEISKYKA